jgi:hypothetical protein
MDFVLTVDTNNPWIGVARRKAGADGLEMKKIGCCLIWRFVPAVWRSKYSALEVPSHYTLPT